MGNEEFAQALAGQNVVQISYVMSKNGKRRTIPVWFTVDGGRIQLLPMYGLKTKWFQDIEKSGTVDLLAGKRRLSAAPMIIKDSVRVEQIQSLFARKYGSVDVKRYYPTSEVAFEIPL